MTEPVSRRLPEPVQTTIRAVVRRAEAYDGPVVDLSIGAPTDPTPSVIRDALAAAADSPGYPLTVGRRSLREAYVAWLRRAHGVDGLEPDCVLPVIGTKELIGSIGLHLGLGPGDVIAQPRLAYPTYAVGTALIGAERAYVDSLADLEALPTPPRLLWVNSPANPTGRVADAAELAGLAAWCREHGTLLVSDECYLDLGWDATPVSMLHPEVCGADHRGVLAVHSLSKRSNLAGYRCGFVSGDAEVVAELLRVRRNLGLQMPGPQQQVAEVALSDDAHVRVQRDVYEQRRALLLPALRAAGFRIDHSEAGLYLWATRDEPAADTVGWLADLGLVTVSGEEYGPAGARHVRFALTASDDGVRLAVERLATVSSG